ncbi:MAG: DNA-binding transcriptional regulator [Rubripirellula sp.]
MQRVALLIETSKAFGRGLLAGVGRYARTQPRWSTYVDERGLGDPIPDWLEAGDFDGIIVRAADQATFERVLKFGIPTVCLGEENPSHATAVMNDDAACAEVAAQHLLDRRFRSFGYLGNRGFNWSDDRREHFIRSLADSGFQCDVLESSVTTTRRTPWYKRRERLANWITTLQKPVGIFACYDAAARTVLDVCRDLNLLVPEQVAVIGVDNDEVLCELCDPPLTSVAPDTEAIGLKAAELLDDWMRAEEVGQRTEAERLVVIPPSGVVTRGSTDTDAIDDPLIAEVVGYIRKHTSDGIDVSDLLEKFPVSRRTLERRFEKVLQQSPHELIRHVRINHVKTLLRETDMKLDTICSLAGYNYTAYMVAQFRDSEGQTPGQFRKHHRS